MITCLSWRSERARSANRQNIVRPLDCAGRLAINGQIFGRHDVTGDDHG